MEYICTNCEAKYTRWVGKCPNCGEWDTLEESDEDEGGSKGSSKKAKPVKTKSFSGNLRKKGNTQKRISTGFGELDRVLGGGVVNGEVILVSGQPGIGKSTILLEAAIKLTKDKKVFYVSGEESYDQIRGRVDRLARKYKKDEVNLENLSYSDDVEVERIVTTLEDDDPDLVIVDSIQTVKSLDSDSPPGSISQVRYSGNILTRAAKKLQIPVIVVGQITKSGNIAGPKLLEHLVDCVLYLEGDEFNYYRIIRSVKNRFGSTNEIGVFEIRDKGIVEVTDPSKAFLGDDDNKNGVPGSVVSAVIKGSRVVFVEIQALTVDRDMDGVPLRRVANGIKKSRLDILCAVLSRRGNVFLGDKDVFVNVVGGLNLNEPSIDLAICAAIKSAVQDQAVEKDVVYAGEVGLTGEVRGVFGTEKIIKEAGRLGYKQAVVGKGRFKKGKKVRILTKIKDL